MNELLIALAIYGGCELVYDLEGGYEKRGILAVLALLELGLCTLFDLKLVGWLLYILTIDLFVLFYHQEDYMSKGYLVAQLVLFTISFLLRNIYGSVVCSLLTIIGIYELVLWQRTHKLSWIQAALAILGGIFILIALQGQELLGVAGAILLVLMIELVYRQYSAVFTRSTRDFQNQVMAHHYEEVKSVYQNMRGWRHDYHNHLQTIKAYLSFAQYEEASRYLLELEEDLKRVDSLVKSGHLMMDAILNSKLSLAIDKKIHITCTMSFPEELSVSDIDICVIVSNLMDNALEAALKLPEEERFIRIYGAIVKQQLYISITNAAQEDLNFNERNYISEKRGDHGHGMKRVKLAVDNYGGYLNLKNEPGVFVSEVMIPLS